MGPPVVLDSKRLLYVANSADNSNGIGLLCCLDYTTNTPLWTYPGPSDPGAGNHYCPANVVLVDKDRAVVYFNNEAERPITTTAVLVNTSDGTESSSIPIYDQFESLPTATSFTFGDAVVFHSNINIYLWLPEGFNAVDGDPDPTPRVLQVPTRYSTDPSYSTVVTDLVAQPNWVAYTYQQGGSWHLARTEIKRDHSGITHVSGGWLDEAFAAGGTAEGLTFLTGGYRLYVTIGGTGEDADTVQSFPTSDGYGNAKVYPMPTVSLAGSPVGAAVGYGSGGTPPEDLTTLCLVLTDAQAVTATLKGPGSPVPSPVAALGGAPISGPVGLGSGPGVVFVAGADEDGDGQTVYWFDTSQSPPIVHAIPPLGDGTEIITPVSVEAEMLAVSVQYPPGTSGSVVGGTRLYPLSTLIP